MQIKKIFRAALLCLVFAVSPSVARAADPPVLSVVGSGVVQGTPDEAIVSIGVVTRRRTAGEAQRENAQKASSVRAALLEIGVSEADIRTEEYSFRQAYGSDGKGGKRLDGYSATNTIRVRVRDISAVGKVIDEALKNGANTVRSLEFSISDTEALREEALAQAVKDAGKKADAISQALGVNIVGVLRVTENTGMFKPREINMSMAKAADFAAAESTPVAAGTVTLKADVHIDFALAG